MSTSKRKEPAIRKAKKKAVPRAKLITSFGRFWTPIVVQWGHPGSLVGHGKNEKRQGSIDFWNARGIYVLHKEYDIVYVGQTEGQALGLRIQQHLSDNLAGRWDAFSWYSVSTVTKTGKIKDLAIASRGTVPYTTTINTLEALGISLTPQALNKQDRKFPGAKEYVQSVDKDTKKIIERNLITERTQIDQMESGILALQTEIGKLKKQMTKIEKKA